MSYQKEEIEAIVRQVVTKTLGDLQAPPVRRSDNLQKRSILDAEQVNALPAKSVHVVPPHTIVTPLARQAALERGIRLTEAESSSHHSFAAKSGTLASPIRQSSVAIGADHGGFALKQQLIAMLESSEFGYTVIDCGTHSADSVDYPDYAYAVAQLVANGRVSCGIMIDGAGIGSCMAANKVPGVRAAMCYDQATAVNSREHNNANVLTLGAGLIGSNLAQQIVSTWLKTEFGGGRHGRRVDKIDAIGKRFSK